MSSKADTIASIVAAGTELDKALAHLEALPVFDPDNVLLAAHSLNNYLSVIEGIVDLLSVRLRGSVDSDVCLLIEHLGHSNTLMRQTVKRLTDTSAAGDTKLMRRKVDIRNLVEHAVTYYREFAAKKNIAISFEYTAQKQYAHTDTVAIAAVLDNLLSNAVKYSSFGKKIAVTVRGESDSLVCDVRDEGPGISEDDRNRLFSRGGKLGHVPTAGEASAGYGLAVAKELIDKLDGEIWCKSQESQGATFSFRVPLS